MRLKGRAVGERGGDDSGGGSGGGDRHRCDAVARCQDGAGTGAATEGGSAARNWIGDGDTGCRGEIRLKSGDGKWKRHANGDGTGGCGHQMESIAAGGVV